MTKPHAEDWPFHEALTPEREAALRRTADALPLFKLLGLRSEEYATDYAKLSVDYRDEISRPGGVLHGGIHATLVDTAVAHAIITTIRREWQAVTVHLDVRYFKPTTQGRVFAEAKVIRKGKRIVHGDVHLLDDAGDLVGKGSCVYAITRAK
ncbi:MAG: PaaI family thioesterase [Candidatus Methylomirabilis sp.]|nr:PaaI family thioesterase [Deltaproteobacteria bacterium]